jgi:hypothetical protein
MELRSFLHEIAVNFDRNAPMSHPTQVLLRDAPAQIGEHIPPGLLVQGSGGRGSPTDTPWVGIFDPDETSSPHQGIYLVYLFSSDLSTVSISLLQGMEDLRREIGDAAARVRLASDAEMIRGNLSPGALDLLSVSLDLGPDPGARQKAYIAANIACREYAISMMPAEDELRADLFRFLRIYEESVSAKRSLLQRVPGSMGSPSAPQVVGDDKDPLSEFKPKDEGDYLAHLAERTLVKTRRHERLVREYAEWATQRGFVASTEHPRDLVLRRDETEWIVEAKVVRRGNATDAVRAAVGQLFAYKYAFYDADSSVGLLALFSEAVGEFYLGFLHRCNIEAIWWEGGRWAGSAGAMSAGLGVELQDGQPSE